MIDKNNDRYKRGGTKIKKTDCQGCEDNFYNGNNNLGVNECWHFSKATMILRKQVHVDQVPPWNQSPVRVPSCYKVKRYVFVDPHKTC